MVAGLKTLVFISALVPATRLVVLALTGGDLTANPIEYITRDTGWYALFFLTLTLTVTPIRRLTGWHPVIRFRRMLGLFAFFYGTLHLLVWIVLDRFFDAEAMGEDILKRPFITVGMTTFLLLLPLAITSTSGWIRRLGGRRWARLHQLAYLAAVTAVLHFWWLVKSDVREPYRWGWAVAVLLGARMWWSWQAGRSSRS